MRHVVIVGASAAGLSAAETLRAEGFDGALTIVGEKRHAPYDRPPLSKQLLSGAWEADRLTLRDQAALDALKAEWRLGARAVALDAARGSPRSTARRARRFAPPRRSPG